MALVELARFQTKVEPTSRGCCGVRPCIRCVDEGMITPARTIMPIRMMVPKKTMPSGGAHGRLGKAKASAARAEVDAGAGGRGVRVRRAAALIGPPANEQADAERWPERQNATSCRRRIRASPPASPRHRTEQCEPSHVALGIPVPWRLPMSAAERLVCHPSNRGLLTISSRPAFQLGHLAGATGRYRTGRQAGAASSPPHAPRRRRRIARLAQKACLAHALDAGSSTSAGQRRAMPRSVES